MKALFPLLLLALTVFGSSEPRPLTDSLLSAWVTAKADFILFDVRGDAAPDSINAPCFYATEADRWVDSLSCRKTLAVVCHSGILAAQVARRIIAKGWNADSVFAGGYNLIPSVRRPARDTLPLALLDRTRPLPPAPSPFELRALSLSLRPYRIVDVRTETEVREEGIIPGACNVAWPTPFQTESATIDRSAFIVLYCRSGSRAGSALAYLRSLGFDSTRTVNFGAFSRWTSAGLPVAATATEVCRCVGIERGAVSMGKRLLQATPNPFNTAIKISFSGNPVQGAVILRIFNPAGRLLAEHSSGPGHGEWIWNAAGLAAGAYLVGLEGRGFRRTLPIFLKK